MPDVLVAQLRDEFNRWAEAGRGEGMERDHLPIVEPMLALMKLQPGETILDFGCGTGWLCRLLAARLPQSRVVGIDLSDEMIHRAQAASEGFTNVSFSTGSIQSIPSDNGFFRRAISVESAYYWPRPAEGLKEIFRVLAPGGSFWMLINYYHDNPYCHSWSSIFTIPTHLLSVSDWTALFHQAGFTHVATQRIPDPTPVPETYTGRWFGNAEELRRFRKEGALLVYGTKST